MASAKEGSCKIFGGKRMNKVLKLLRYNTGNDKKAFVEFKNDFDAVIFNASIVAYSGASISDIISINVTPLWLFILTIKIKLIYQFFI